MQHIATRFFWRGKMGCQYISMYQSNLFATEPYTNRALCDRNSPLCFQKRALFRKRHLDILIFQKRQSSSKETLSFSVSKIFLSKSFFSNIYTQPRHKLFCKREPFQIELFFKRDTPPTMGWLRLVGSLKLCVSFAEHIFFYRAFLQKRPMILRSLLIETISYHRTHPDTCRH